MTEFPQSRISSAEGSSMFTYYTRKNSACKLWITDTGVVSRQLPLRSTAALAAIRAMSLVPVAPLRKAVGLRAWTRRGLRVVTPVLSGVEGVFRESPIACHAEAMCEGRSILLCWL